MKDHWQEAVEAANRIREHLGLPPKFFTELKSESDWSFIIKIHALCETSLTWCLEKHLHDSKLGDFVPKWDLCGGRSNKVDIGIAIGILERENAKFIRGLSKIRNRLVHNVRHVGFDLESYIAELSNEECLSYLRETMAHFWDESLSALEKQKLKISLLEKPKGYLLVSTIILLGLLSLHVDNYELKKEHEDLRRQVLEFELEKTKKMLESLGYNSQ